MSFNTLALLLEPAAWLGAVTTLIASLCVLWRYRGSGQDSLNWYLANWRMRQTLGISALFYLALAASCFILHDRWGLFYCMIAFILSRSWLKRLLNERSVFPHLLRSRSRA